MGKYYEPSDAEFVALVGGIAKALGKGWSVESASVEHRTPRAELRHAEYGLIALNTNYGAAPGKLAVYGRFPHSQDHTPPSGHSIGVSPERGAVAIAKDITRRLLPDFKVAREEFLGKVAASLAYHAKCLSNAKRLAAAGGVEVHKDRHSGVESPTFYIDGTDVQVHGDSVYFQRLSVSLNVAERILQVLATAEAAKEAGKELDGERIV